MSDVMTVVFKIHGDSEIKDKLFDSFVDRKIIDNLEVYAISLLDEIARVEELEKELETYE